MLAENLIMLRNLKGMTQEQIAEVIGISRQAYAKWESGETVPDIAKCDRLAGFYQIKMDDLMHKVAGRTDLAGFENMMEAVQKRIDAVDAKAALNEELADTMDIKKLEEKYSEKAAAVSASVEADLAALKARLGK